MMITPSATSPSIPLSPGMDLTAYASQRRPNDQKAIDSAATEFESVFLSLLMKEMRQTLSEGSMFDQDKGDVLGGLFDHCLGQHLAPAGALGIAAMVKKSWEMRGDHEPAGHGRSDHAHPATATRTAAGH